MRVLTYEELDRLFYEHIRREVVAVGFAVDQLLFNNQNAYESARTTLRSSLLTQNTAYRMVDILSVGTWDDKDEKGDARIVIIRTGEELGTIGGSPVPFYQAKVNGSGVTTFDKYQYPDMSTTVTYDVRVISDQVVMERILLKLVARVLGTRRFMPTVDAQLNTTDDYVCVVRTNFNDLSNQRYMERSFAYQVQDVFIEESDLLVSDIPRLTTLHYLPLAGDDVTGVINVGPKAPPTDNYTRVDVTGRVRKIVTGENRKIN